LIQTAPGYQQDPVLSWTTLVPPGVRPGDRFLLYYTGQRRMAKNILRQIIGRYLNRERQVLQTLDELKELALAMKEDLDHRRLDDFGAKIGAAWECNKRLDSGSTTPEIEAILDRVSTWTIGAKLLGAGGGGFCYWSPPRR
jgi:galactokinase/mevalonate kinase-like predicted kinase